MKGRYRKDFYRDAGKMGEVEAAQPSLKDRFVKILSEGWAVVWGRGCAWRMIALGGPTEFQMERIQDVCRHE